MAQQLTENIQRRVYIGGLDGTEAEQQPRHGRALGVEGREVAQQQSALGQLRAQLEAGKSEMVRLGLAEPAGLVNSSTKVANARQNFVKIDTKFDNFGSNRYLLDVKGIFGWETEQEFPILIGLNKGGDG